MSQQSRKQKGGQNNSSSSSADGASSSRRDRGGGRGNANPDFKTEDIFQAVILADSFNSRFKPVTLEEPRVLLPLANTALIDYVLEFLISGNVQEIFVFCRSHAEKIKNYIAQSRWSARTDVSIKSIVSQECVDVGNALREIDQLGVIKTDFVLISGDLVSNMGLMPLLEAHRKSKETDKGTIMTMVCKAASPHHRTRSLEKDSVMALEMPSKRLLAISPQESPNKGIFEVPSEVFSQHTNVQIRYDLFNCHIAICSKEVPSLFTDNFDFTDVHKFVKGILDNEEVLGNKIHIYEINHEYAAKVDNIRAYDAISKDIIHRWTFPMVPDYSSHPNDNYKYGRNNIYKEDGVILSRSCTLVEDVIIGRGTVVGEETVISRSTIGRRCKIGNNVRIEGSYIWDDVEIKDGTIITQSLICDNSVIHENVTIEPGCIVSYHAKLGPNIKIDKDTKLTTLDENDDIDDNLQVDKSVVGAQGFARIFAIDPDMFEDDELPHLFWETNSKTKVETESEDESDEEEDADVLAVGQSGEDKFLREISEYLEEVFSGDSATVDISNIQVEVNGSKHANNVYIGDMAPLVVRAVLDLAFTRSNDAESFKKSFTELISRHNSVLVKLIKMYMKTADDQVDSIQGIFDAFSAQDKEPFRAAFLHIIHTLYNKDLLEEDHIVAWYEEHSKESNEVKAKLRESLTRFVTWLQQAEENSEDEE